MPGELFWELRQNERIGEATRLAGRAQHATQEASLRLYAAERRAEKALLVCEALWNIVRDHLSLGDDALLEMVAQVDATDGRRDGKVRRPPQQCANCGRSSPSRMELCMYCGATLGPAPFSG